MSYCKNCGTKLEATDKFCKKCGTKVSIIDSKEKTVKEVNLAKEKESLDLLKLDEDFKNTSEKKGKVSPQYKHNETKETIENITNEITNEQEKKTKNNIEDATVLIDSKDVHEELGKTQEIDTLKVTNDNELMEKSYNKKEKAYSMKNHYEELDEEDEEEDQYEEDESTKRNKKILILTLVLILISSIVVAFVFKDSIMCRHYLKKANKEISEMERVRNYNKALGYKYKNEIIDEIYETIKNADDFEEKVAALHKLKEEDRKKLLIKILTYKAKDSFNKENYGECAKLLEKAKANGYNPKEFANYNELLNKLKAEDKKEFDSNASNQYTYKNSNPTIGDSYVNSLGDVYYKNHSGYDNLQGYIVPQSHERYLTEDELKNYDKYTLDLIRNEIFARRGYIFKEQPFKSYFANKNWYVQSEYFKGDESELNDYEIKNVKLLLELAKKR